MAGDVCPVCGIGPPGRNDYAYGGTPTNHLDCVRQENASKLRVWNRNRELQAENELLRGHKDALIERYQKAEAALAGFLGPEGESPTQRKLAQAEAEVKTREIELLMALTDKEKAEAEVETLTQLRPYPNHEWPTVLELTRSLKQAEAEVERLKKVIEQMSDTSKATFTSVYGTKYTMEELAEVIAAYEEQR